MFGIALCVSAAYRSRVIHYLQGDFALLSRSRKGSCTNCYINIAKTVARIGWYRVVSHQDVGSRAEIDKRPFQNDCSVRLKMFQQTRDQPSLRNAS